MGKTTIIAWTQKTFSQNWGCTEVGGPESACSRCYARELAQRFGFNVWGKDAPRHTFGEKYWRQPLLWNKQAEKSGQRIRVFCSSMADIFERHDTVDHERETKLWPLIRATPHLDWQLLTKRAERMKRCLPADWGNGWNNVWLGVSVENQKFADLRLPYLVQIPAVVRFVSAEPLLEPIDFTPWLKDTRAGNGIDQILVGGESGPRYRHMDHAWARDIIAQCRQYGAAPFFKQSSAPRTEMGIRLDGQIVREYPTPRRTK